MLMPVLVKKYSFLTLIIYLHVLIFILGGFSFIIRYLQYHSPQHLAGSLVLFCFSGFLIFASRKNSEFKTNLALFLAGATISVFACEYLMQFYFSQTEEKTNLEWARQQGLSFDTRTPLQVLEDLKNTGEEYYLVVQASSFRRLYNRPLLINEKEVIPFGGVANVNTLLCNESGTYVTYDSDEFGFNNPPGVWKNKNKTNLYFVGDSFTQGRCVPREDTFVDRVRKQFPDTIAMGISNNGPLSELGSLREYLHDLKTSYVFWMYFEGNDLTNLNEEKGSPILMNYLEPNFSQQLKKNFGAINASLKSYMNTLVEEEKNKIHKTQIKEETKNIWQNMWTHPLNFFFPSIYSLAKKTFTLKKENYKFLVDMELFEKVMRQAKSFVNETGGKLVFVYLPSYESFAGLKTIGALAKKDVLQIIEKINVDFIDMEAEFEKLKDPKSVFPFRKKNHYNVLGNFLIAEQIIKYLHANNPSSPHQTSHTGANDNLIRR